MVLLLYYLPAIETMCAVNRKLWINSARTSPSFYLKNKLWKFVKAAYSKKLPLKLIQKFTSSLKGKKKGRNESVINYNYYFISLYLKVAQQYNESI